MIFYPLLYLIITLNLSVSITNIKSQVVETLVNVPGAVARKVVEKTMMARIFTSSHPYEDDDSADSDNSRGLFATEVGQRQGAPKIYEDDTPILRGNSEMIE